MSIISENEFNEFRGIIAGNGNNSYDYFVNGNSDNAEQEDENDNFYDDDLLDDGHDDQFIDGDEFKNQYDANDDAESKSYSYRILASFILIGVLLFIITIISTILYIRAGGTLEQKQNPKSKSPTNSFKIPGMNELTMNPEADSKITVWCLRLTEPPPPVIADYSAFFHASKRNNGDL